MQIEARKPTWSSKASKRIKLPGALAGAQNGNADTKDNLSKGNAPRGSKAQAWSLPADDEDDLIDEDDLLLDEDKERPAGYGKLHWEDWNSL